jgi:hypothetical protein
MMLQETACAPQAYQQVGVQADSPRAIGNGSSQRSCSKELSCNRKAKKPKPARCLSPFANRFAQPGSPCVSDEIRGRLFRSIEVNKAQRAASPARPSGFLEFRALHERVTKRWQSEASKSTCANIDKLPDACQENCFTVVFKPGSLGVRVKNVTGKVILVEEMSQAQRAGVKVGMVMQSVAGEAFSIEVLRKAGRGDVDYEIALRRDSMQQQSKVSELRAKFESGKVASDQEFGYLQNGPRISQSAGRNASPQPSRDKIAKAIVCSSTLEISQPGDPKEFATLVASAQNHLGVSGRRGNVKENSFENVSNPSTEYPESDGCNSEAEDDKVSVSGLSTLSLGPRSEEIESMLNELPIHLPNFRKRLNRRQDASFKLASM